MHRMPERCFSILYFYVVVDPVVAAEEAAEGAAVTTAVAIAVAIAIAIAIAAIDRHSSFLFSLPLLRVHGPTSIHIRLTPLRGVYVGIHEPARR